MSEQTILSDNTYLLGSGYKYPNTLSGLGECVTDDLQYDACFADYLADPARKAEAIQRIGSCPVATSTLGSFQGQPTAHIPKLDKDGVIGYKPKAVARLGKITTTSERPAEPKPIFLSSGSPFPVINSRQAADDVLIHNSTLRESYYVPKVVAADAVMKAALYSTPSTENYKDFVIRMEKMLQAGNAGKGHIFTYEEAKWWWTYGNGKTLRVDGRELSTVNFGMGDFVVPWPLDSLKVHGSVTPNPKAPDRIFDGMYDFDRKPNDNFQLWIRNILNDMAIEEHGAGTPYKIQYIYDDYQLEYGRTDEK